MRLPLKIGMLTVSKKKNAISVQPQTSGAKIKQFKHLNLGRHSYVPARRLQHAPAAER